MEKEDLDYLLSDFYKNKKILVTGGTGSIGSELVKQLLKLNPQTIRVYSRDETKQQELSQQLNAPIEVLRFLIGDIRDKERLQRAMEEIDIVFHAAALKHVPSCEFNPFEAVKTNVIGTQNLIEVAIDNEVEKFINISTDKATSPSNVMGATKLLAERLTTSANYYKGRRKTIFSSVRFGNVLGSRGSVLPIFKKQIEGGGPITLTHPDMTRFMMSIEEAAKLVLKACVIAQGGEVFILKMPTFKIIDLIDVLIEELAPRYGYQKENIEIKDIGLRLGEKIDEALMTEEEESCAIELNNMYVIKSTREGGFVKPSKATYISKNEKYLTKEKIREFLIKERLI